MLQTQARATTHLVYQDRLGLNTRTPLRSRLSRPKSDLVSLISVAKEASLVILHQRLVIFIFLLLLWTLLASIKLPSDTLRYQGESLRNDDLSSYSSIIIAAASL
jgi:hypothetical protein